MTIMAIACVDIGVCLSKLKIQFARNFGV
jgi:hypothetical protein